MANDIKTSSDYYEAKIVSFDENNVPETKKTICIRTNGECPNVEDIIEQLEDDIDIDGGEEIRDINEISAEEACECYGVFDIIEL